MSQKILQTGLTQYWIKEFAGSSHNPEVLKYFKALGFGSLTDETAWCSAFMNWVAMTAGYEYTKKLTARSWLKIGAPVTLGNVIKGDVVIILRESPGSWKGHVGIYVRHDERYIYVLGGNQSNRVKIKGYPRSRLLGIRRLKKS